jgi:glycine cleavage system H protein
LVKVEGNDFPEDIYYHREHMWVRVEGDLVRVGYNDWAQSAASKLVSIKTKKAGSPVQIGKTLGTVESGKWVGPLKVPITGEIKELNEEVLKNPTLINKDPYGQGWVAVIKPENLKGELPQLIKGTDIEQLKAWLAAEKARVGK